MELKLGVFSLLPKMNGFSSEPTLFGSAEHIFLSSEIDWLFSRGHTRSLLRYWNDVTPHGVEVVAEVHHDEYEVDERSFDVLASGDREPVTREFIRLLQMHGRDPLAYDRLVLFLRFRDGPGGALNLDIDGHLVSIAIFGGQGSLMFLQHEVGHALGLGHPFDGEGLQGQMPNGEYGDPCCIMSAEWNNDSAFSIPDDERGPVTLLDSSVPATNNGWDRGGPGLSMATAWRWLPGFPEPQPWVTVLEPSAVPTEVRLAAAGGPGTVLAAMPVGSKPQWVTAEYRPGADWDRGMSDTTGFGVIIHEIRDVGSTSQNPPGKVIWPKPNTVCSWRTALPISGQLDASGNGFSIRVLEHDEHSALILFGAQDLPDERRFHTRVTLTEGDPFERHSDAVATVTAGPRCTPTELPMIEFANDAIAVVAAEASGFSDPRFRFEVNGTPVLKGKWTEPGAVSSSEMVFLSVTGTRPTGPDTTEPIADTSVRMTLVDNTLRLRFAAGVGEFQVTVRAFVRENSGGPEIESVATFDVVTVRLQLPRSALVAMVECQASKVLKVKKTWPPDPDEHPDWRQRLNDLATAAVRGDQELIGRALGDFGRRFDVEPDSLAPSLRTTILDRRPG